jgi:[ribosomal protein S18]-alanine N-acetyltransferase
VTPKALAAIHAASFVVPRPWSEAEFADLLASPTVFLLTESEGFLLGRVVADEAELLTLAVTPTNRRKGIGQRLVGRFLSEARSRGARHAFLEVSAENLAAIMLYRAIGFVDAGRRKAYYRAADGQPSDALVLSFNLQG